MPRQTRHDAQVYQGLVLDTVLSPDWKTVLSEASRCSATCGDARLVRLGQLARDYRPSGLVRLRENVVAWLNNEEMA